MMDSGNLRLRAKHPQSRQGVCADAIATLEGISREDTDRLALLSQQGQRPRRKFPAVPVIIPCGVH